MTLYKNRIFHPLEVSFCGFSGSGKTTLIEKLIKKLSNKYKVGYMKHDGHRFVMDKEGKDTDKASKAGASTVAISSDSRSAILHPYDDTFYLNRIAFIDMDLVLVEGFKNSLMQKILIVNDSKKSMKILDDYKNGELKEVIAIIGESNNISLDDLPYFQRDDIDGIIGFIEKQHQNIFKETPLNALILGGGKSTRMGEDKGALEYHGKTQVAHLHDLLIDMVDNVYVSCREEQKDEEHLKKYNLVFDKYMGFGPTGGILSAFSHTPNAAWLVIACDMPFITKQSLSELIEGRNPYKLATCFYNEKKDWLEPLFSIFEPKANLKLGFYLANNKRGPGRVINNSNIEIIKTKSQEVLKNVNTQEEREVVLNS